LSLLRIVEAVAAVQVIDEAQSRIPVGLRGLTFYGEDDEWLFLQSGHPNMCNDCAACDGNVYSGSELRSVFPYHTIIDENTIAASVHPNCSCLLLRAVSMGSFL
jgi:hypothetical protein